MAKPLNPPKKHHLVIRWVAVLSVGVFLFTSGKSRKVQADSQAILEIAAPSVHFVQNSPILPPLAAIASPASMAPRAETLERSLVTITGRDGLPIMARLSNNEAAVGIYKRSYVSLTKDLAKVAQEISKYFAENNMQALITSGVRTSKGQLELIKDRIAERGMLKNFPGLQSATMKDTAIWKGAWEWLKARRVPINAPGDYVNDDGKKVGGSLHLKGLAMDLIADDLSELKKAIDAYAASPGNRKKKKGLRVVGAVLEPDCVHISLAK